MIKLLSTFILIMTIHILYGQGWPNVDTVNINKTDKNGLKQGLWKSYYPNGSKKQCVFFFNNHVSMIYNYWDNGWGKSRFTLPFGKLYFYDDVWNPEKINLFSGDLVLGTGTTIEYFRNSKIWKQTTYKDSVQVGCYKEYSKDGSIYCIGKYWETSDKLYRIDTINGNVLKLRNLPKKDFYWFYFDEEGEIWKMEQYDKGVQLKGIQYQTFIEADYMKMIFNNLSENDECYSVEPIFPYTWEQYDKIKKW